MYASLECQQLLGDCVGLYVQRAHLLLQALRLCFLGLSGAVHIVTEARIVILHGLFGVLDFHREHSLQGVFLRTHHHNLLSVILDLCEDVAQFIFKILEVTLD